MSSQVRGESTQRLPRVGNRPVMRDEVKPLVILVDDNKEFTDALSTLIRVLGYRVEVLSSGDIAAPVIVAVEPAFALIDLCMPGMNGWDVARHVRSHTPSIDTRLISISGLADPVIRARSTRAGFDAHLVKPVTADDLRRVLSIPA